VWRPPDGDRWVNREQSFVGVYPRSLALLVGGRPFGIARYSPSCAEMGRAHGARACQLVGITSEPLDLGLIIKPKQRRRVSTVFVTISSNHRCRHRYENPAPWLAGRTRNGFQEEVYANRLAGPIYPPAPSTRDRFACLDLLHAVGARRRCSRR
jgi:hypothetical protein